MRLFQHRVGCRERKTAVRAVTNDRSRRFVCRPGDQRAAELVRFRNVRHQRRQQINPRRGQADRLGRRILVDRLDGVALPHLQPPVRHRHTGEDGDVIGEHTQRTGRPQREGFPIRFGGTVDEDIDGGLSCQVGVDQLHFDDIRRSICLALQGDDLLGHTTPHHDQFRMRTSP